MPITTTIARHYAWRCIIIAIVFLVLGLWGVYDYMVAIPAREQQFLRGEICRLVSDAFEPGHWDEAAPIARERITAEIERIGSEHFKADQSQAFDAEDLSEEAWAARAADVQAAIASIRERNEDGWFMALLLFREALRQPPFDYPLTGVDLLAHETAQSGAQAVAGVSQPSRYDRPTQWAFMACLPFVPYYVWAFVATRRRVYRMDEDGTLHLPQGTWAQDDIADIDMSRWMAKSIAHVVHRDGTRVKLDDYKHRNLHLIIGAVASRLYPDQWQPDAKQIKSEQAGPQETEAAAEVEPTSAA
jgi:hypothetical protein